MRGSFFPSEYYDSAYSIDYKALYEQGVRGIIYDIDNTLVEHGAPADARSRALAEELHTLGLRVLFLSNNKEPRVRSFSEGMPYSSYICRANKPAVAGYRRAMEQMGTEPASTVFVGDQIFTDIWGANRAGIRGILVDRIAVHEEIQIHAKRVLEQPVKWLWFLAGGRKQRRNK